MLCLSRVIATCSGPVVRQVAASTGTNFVRGPAKCRIGQTSLRLLSVTAVSRTSQPAVVGDSTTEAVIQTVSDGAQALAGADPSFTVLGLAHAYPSGWIQAIMEVLHVDAGLSWCATIATSTVLLRLLVFPLMVKQRKTAVKNNNISPQIQRIQLALQAATEKEEQQKLLKQFQDTYDKQGITPLTPLKPLLGNGLAFMSMFFAIRGMANAPVPSMTTGGLGWFSDLTVADPIFLLPVLTSTTLAVCIHLNAEGTDMSQMPPFMRTFFRVMPWLTLPVMIQFPAALNFYWLTNNAITLCQARLLSQKSVRQRLGIGELIKWKDEDLPLKNNPFAWMTKSTSKSLEERIKEEHAKDDERRKSSCK